MQEIQKGTSDRIAVQAAAVANRMTTRRAEKKHGGYNLYEDDRISVCLDTYAPNIHIKIPAGENGEWTVVFGKSCHTRTPYTFRPGLWMEYLGLLYGRPGRSRRGRKLRTGGGRKRKKPGGTGQLTTRRFTPGPAARTGLTPGRRKDEQPCKRRKDERRSRSGQAGPGLPVLGWGIQSWTLAAMTALGELPMPDLAIHSDTGHEATGTYRHAEKWTSWLEERGLRVETIKPENGDVFHAGWKSVQIPAFTLSNATGDEGMVKRQCTGHWKIMPIRRRLREILGKKRPRPGAVEMWIGYSLDEWKRMKDSGVKYVRHEYPLVDMRMTRGQCAQWLESRGLEIPPKSACTFCPYHSAGEWQRMKRAEGRDWEEALAADAAVRERRPGHLLYVHNSRLPLAEAVDIPEDRGEKQLELEMHCDSGHCFT